MNENIKRIIEKIKNGENLTDMEKYDFIGYSICKHESGEKMSGFQSIGTSCLENENCLRRCKNEKYICYECYAMQQLKRYKTQRKKNKWCTYFYTSYDISKEYTPFINSTYFRFESFGELQNELQVKNYFTICEKNCNCNFTIWTKQPEYIKLAMDKYGIKKPKNLKVIYSRYELNQKPSIDYFRQLKTAYPFLNKMFSVFSKGFATENKININCNGHCESCLKCYDPKDRTILINEIRKKDKR